MENYLNKPSYVSTLEVASKLNVTADYIRQLVRRGKIKAEKVGVIWLIDKQELAKVERRFSRNKEIKDERGSKRKPNEHC